MSTKKTSLHLQQAGIASLLFSMVMMIVITLIVLSFAQLTRRGQREALDSQLSAQAYYAAESGINDAMQVVAASVRNNPEAEVSNPGCALTGKFAPPAIASTELSPGVSYTCLRVNTTPSSLVSSITTQSSKVLTITPKDGDMSNLKITWKPAENTLTNTQFKAKYDASCPTKGTLNGDFPIEANWKCPYGILRFDLVPTSGTLSRKALLENTMTVFAVPAQNVQNTVADKPLYNLVYNGHTQQGIRASAQCGYTTTSVCEINITDFPAGVTSYAMRASAKYLTIPSLVVSATDDGVPLAFKNSQAVIDVTGKAQDVLRRIEVHMPLGGTTGGYSDYALETAESICKRFNVSEGNYLNGVPQNPANIHNTSYSKDDVGACPTYAAP